MREIVLVGAKHAVTISSAINTVRCEVAAPEDFAEVTGLSEGGTVALEIAPNTRAFHLPTDVGFPYTIPFDDRYLHPGETERKYEDPRGQGLFGNLKAVLLDTGHPVDPLDHQRWADLTHDFAKILDESWVWSYMGMTARQARLVRHAQVLGHFMDSTLREDYMFDQIAQSKAEVVVIGRAHADRLAVHESLQERAGVKIAELLRLEPDVEAHFYPHDTWLDSYLYPVSLSAAKEDAKLHDIERELHRRRYNAHSIGRVLDRKEPEPAYLGRFYISGDAEDSLFELHIHDQNGDQFSGMIHDCLGDATVEGTISNGRICFTKTYIEGTVMPGKNYQPLHYVGELNDRAGQFEGRYGTSSENGLRPVFTMRDFEKGARKALDHYNPGLWRNHDIRLDLPHSFGRESR